MRKYAALATVSAIFISIAAEPACPQGIGEDLVITKPATGSAFCGPMTVTGTITAKASDAAGGVVWLVLEEIVGQRKWVEPQASQTTATEWSGDISIGSPSTPAGYRYNVRAFVAPVPALKVGPIDGWPTGAFSSFAVPFTKC